MILGCWLLAAGAGPSSRDVPPADVRQCGGPDVGWVRRRGRTSHTQWDSEGLHYRQPGRPRCIGDQRRTFSLAYPADRLVLPQGTSSQSSAWRQTTPSSLLISTVFSLTGTRGGASEAAGQAHARRHSTVAVEPTPCELCALVRGIRAFPSARHTAAYDCQARAALRSVDGARRPGPLRPASGSSCGTGPAAGTGGGWSSSPTADLRLAWASKPTG